MTRIEQLEQALREARSAVVAASNAPHGRTFGDVLARIDALLSQPEQAEQSEREAFEAWITNEAGVGATKYWLDKPQCGYENTRVQDYRTGWLAALFWRAHSPTPAQTEQQPVVVPDGCKLIPGAPSIEVLTAMSVALGMEPLGDGSDGSYPITGQQSTVRQCYMAVFDAIATPIAPAPQHSDDAAVDRFAVAMKAKLAAARAKGRSGWDDPDECSVEFLAQLLVRHLTKGNAGTFEDVANFAMMLHQRKADPKVLAEAAEAPIKKARGDALELGVKALESKTAPQEQPKQRPAAKVSLRMLDSGRGVAELRAWDLSMLSPGMNTLYAAQQEQSKWISVEDRLPQMHVPVIVWCVGAECAGVAWIAQGAWLMPEPQSLGYETITHWQPLPAAPALPQGGRDE